ncbi:Hypothetical protein A7982_01646 [Minicystis rosea]|nr:Hypothetical protein A7982_01646 [Minicystis rosea]
MPVAGCGEVSKLDGWVQHFNAIHHYDDTSNVVTTHGIGSDQAGDIVFTGLLETPISFGAAPIGTAGAANMFLVKLDANGKFVWNVASAPLDEKGAVTAHALTVSAAGDIHVAGGWAGKVTLGGDPLPEGEGFGAYVAKYDSAGQHVWDVGILSVGGTDEGFAVRPVGVVGLAEREGQGLALVSQCQHGARVGSIELAGTKQRGLCTFALDPEGKPLWGNRIDAHYEADTPTARIAFDPQGNVIVGGLRDGASSVEAFARKLDANGKEIWLVAFGEGEQTFDGLVVDESGDVLVAGSSADGSSVDRRVRKISAEGKMLWERSVDGVVGLDIGAKDGLLIASSEPSGQYDYRPIFLTADAAGDQTSEALVNELWLPSRVRWYGDGSFLTCGNRTLWPEIVVGRQRFVAPQ